MVEQKINTWYVCAIKDKSLPFGYKQLTPKGRFYQTLEIAREKKKEYEWVHVLPIVILKRTCEVLDK